MKTSLKRTLPLLCVWTMGCGGGDGPSPAGSGGPRTGAASAAAVTAAATSSQAPTAAPLQASPPDVVAKTYLELGAAGDLSKIKDMVDAKCHDTKIGEVDAVRMLGARMTLSETSTSVESEAGDTAKVKYTVKGSVESKGSRTETNIFGKTIEVKAGSMMMSGVTQSGVLTLKKADGRWIVTCP